MGIGPCSAEKHSKYTDSIKEIYDLIKADLKISK